MARIKKEIRRILTNPKDVSFNSIKIILIYFGYEMKQPKKGSSHYILRKESAYPITVLPKKPLKEHYVKEIINILNLEKWHEDKK